MAYSEEEREAWLIRPRASGQMWFHDEGFRAFSRLFVPKIKETGMSNENEIETRSDEALS